MKEELKSIKQRLENIERALSFNDSVEFLDINEVQKLTGLSKQSIYTYKQHNSIPFLKFGRLLRFKKSEIIEWIETRGSQGLVIPEHN